MNPENVFVAGDLRVLRICLTGSRSNNKVQMQDSVKNFHFYFIFLPFHLFLLFCISRKKYTNQ